MQPPPLVIRLLPNDLLHHLGTRIGVIDAHHAPPPFPSHTPCPSAHSPPFPWVVYPMMAGVVALVLGLGLVAVASPTYCCCSRLIRLRCCWVHPPAIQGWTRQRCLSSCLSPKPGSSLPRVRSSTASWCTCHSMPATLPLTINMTLHPTRPESGYVVWSMPPVDTAAGPSGERVTVELARPSLRLYPSSHEHTSPCGLGVRGVP
mmetsp:Transcript_113534/g.197208  ORF Transcript_113534/g.197208 Transcript_113534/m.197208 type:complete len:204 (+) Transcript_113534:1-612(+)